MLLFTQYFTKGYWVAARKVKCRLNKIKVVMFQHMMNTPTNRPSMAVLNALTSPRYSGARNKALAPKDFIKEPLTTANKTTQNTNRIWYFLKWRKSSCTGNE